MASAYPIAVHGLHKPVDTDEDGGAGLGALPHPHRQGPHPMATSPRLRPDADDDPGLFRRTVLTRSASTVGLAPTGGFTDPLDGEFAGPTFSHDRKILFANVQSPGDVYAIQGPFRKQRG
jgi:hypothetical protein